MSTQLAVQAENLVKTYPGEVEAVRGISFEVAAGEAFGLLGPNGAGKTTTIGMLNSTVTPTSGRATLGGRDVARDPMGTRAISSVVFQDAVVDRPLTGRQNLELHLKLWSVAPPEGRTRLAELTRTVGIADILDRASGDLQRRPTAPAGDRPSACSPAPGAVPRRAHRGTGHPDPPRPVRRHRQPAGPDGRDGHHDDPLPRRGRATLRPPGGDRFRARWWPATRRRGCWPRSATRCSSCGWTTPNGPVESCGAMASPTTTSSSIGGTVTVSLRTIAAPSSRSSWLTPRSRFARPPPGPPRSMTSISASPAAASTDTAD